MSEYKTVTFAEQPDLFSRADLMSMAIWPGFMLEEDVSLQLWKEVLSRFPDYQFVLLDADDTIVGYGNSIPITWDGTPDGLPEHGWDGAILHGIALYERGDKPDTLCALSITVSPRHRRKGVSTAVIVAMKALAAQHGHQALVVPARPSLKDRYPLRPLERYIQWTTPDGEIFDPWLRTHTRLGARILKIEPESLMVTGSVADWEKWVNMAFPETGDYIVPGALTPVHIDRERNLGRYAEPNVWLVHPIQD